MFRADALFRAVIALIFALELVGLAPVLLNGLYVLFFVLIGKSIDP